MLSRSAGLGSPKGQDGLNYWLCCNSALRLVIGLPALPPTLPAFPPSRGRMGWVPTGHQGPEEGSKEGPFWCSQRWSGGCWDPFLWKAAVLHRPSLPSPPSLFLRGPLAPALLSCLQACRRDGAQGVAGTLGQPRCPAPPS